MGSVDGFLRQYILELQELTFNSKAIINTLTMLAGENKNAATGIAEAIERHIRVSPPQCKLPALYLLDSIVKNIGLPYTALFAGDIPEIFIAVWHAVPASRQSLQKLFGTWQKHFPSDKLNAITQLMSAPQVQQPQQVAQQQQHSQHQAAPYYSYTGQPSTSYTLPSDSRPLAWNQQAQQFLPQQYAQQQTYTVAQQPQQYAHPQYFQQTGVPAAQPTPNYSAAYTPTYPQPQYASGQPLPSGPSPGHVGLQAGVQNGLPAFLSGLLNSGVPTPATAGVLPGAKMVAPTVFDTTRFKELSGLALQQLIDGSNSNKPKFLDQRLLKKRKLAAGPRLARQWFVKESDWLAGTTADAQAIPDFFDLPREEEVVQETVDASVPADPDQPNCAISGERFDSIWDDATSSWRYQGATALTAEQAEQYGLTEGQLVKTSCLEPAREGAGVVSVDDSLQMAQGQEAADGLAEAALAESAKQLPEDDKKNDAPGTKHGLDPADEASPKRQKVE